METEKQMDTQDASKIKTGLEESSRRQREEWNRFILDLYRDVPPYDPNMLAGWCGDPAEYGD